MGNHLNHYLQYWVSRGVLVISFVSLLACSTRVERAPDSSSTSGAVGRASSESSRRPSGSSANAFSPLKIRHSGRLPTSMQGFRLGMDFAEVVRANPGFKNVAGGS